MSPRRILVSAGEASGDLYASALVESLRRRWPEARFFGCTGPRMRAAGVETVVDAHSLAVVGLAEVVTHLPRIWGEFRKLVRACQENPPDLAVLTDSPDFHLRLAPKLKRAGVPVAYLVAPQVWAWRRGRLPLIRRTVDQLLCIFPFEEAFFRRHGIRADYIGHPLSRLARPSASREDFFARHGLPADRPVVALLPGSRAGEAARHLPDLLDALPRIQAAKPSTFLLAAPPGGFFGSHLHGFADLKERISAAPIQVVEGETWNVLAHADVALAASGTVTIEAALLGAPTVTYYRVSAATWYLGRPLVNVPFYSMVNLVAEHPVIPELIQNEMSGERLAAETLRLLSDPEARGQMRRELAAVAARLSSAEHPMERAADLVQALLAHNEGREYVS